MEKRILRQPAADVARSGVTDATLHQAILDDPDDIAARRVYADALIAAGDPRGELINVQCAFEDAIPTERGALLARETALLKAHAKAWMAPFGGAIFRPEFRRGFVEHAYVNPKRFLPVARALLDAEPITSLHMRALSGAGAGLLGQVPGLARLRTLGVTESTLATKGTAALFANPLPRLTRLRLYQAGIDDGGLDALRPLFPQLQRLDLAGTRLTYDGLATVLADPTVAVRYLRLDGLTPGTDGASFLAEHLALPKLTHLDLSSSHLAAHDLAHLTRNPVFRGLRGLRLEYNNLAGAAALEALRPMQQLEVLDLSTTKPGLAGLTALVQHASPLRVLRLYQGDVDDAQLRVLATAPFPLKSLDLGYAKITAAGIAAIGTASWPLETLKLWSCHLGDAGVKALAKASFTSTLRELVLGYTGITDAGLRALGAARFPRLETLTFRGSQFTAAGIKALTAFPALRSVKFDTESPAKSTLRPLLDRGVRID
jgi:uncharacterized protein (TIGR02996 family)